VRAARFHGQRDLRLEDVPSPNHVGPGEVLVRPLWCGICGTDLHEFAAGPIVTPREPHPLTGAMLPQIMGHEFSAVVEDVGAAVTSVGPGDRVAIMPLISCGRCYYCRRGIGQLCDRMAATGLSSAWGGLAERAVVQEYQVARLPEGVTDIQGALIEPGAVALYGVERGRVGMGDTVLVTGGGPIGALSALAAGAAGAARVFLSEPNERRRALADTLGLDDVLDPGAVDVPALMRDLTDGRGVDVAIEAAGSEPSLQTCLAAVRKRGTVAQVALHTGPARIEPFRLALDEVTLVGTWCFDTWDWPKVIALVESGRYPVEKVVTHRIDLDSVVSDGFERLLDPGGDAVKVLVAPDGASQASASAR
jgi:(R,R)-butanediol dehydrogenase/meso-butanediol dehydrogenase/diacetyl reductase